MIMFTKHSMALVWPPKKRALDEWFLPGAYNVQSRSEYCLFLTWMRDITWFFCLGKRKREYVASWGKRDKSWLTSFTQMKRCGWFVHNRQKVPGHHTWSVGTVTRHRAQFWSPSKTRVIMGSLVQEYREQSSSSPTRTMSREVAKN